jgi:prepilin-type N-terminal cleavage/methylation domain-containing protein
MRRRTGFTLLEVLLALLVITVGLLGLAGTLGPVAALAGQGRIRGRIALLVASRLDQIRAALIAGAPACAVPAEGVVRHADGLVESWTAGSGSGVIEVEVRAGLPAGRRALTDTVRTRMPCP